MSLPAGARLGPYEIVAQLGAGGMGVVYRARDPRLGREVAIKVLSAGLSGDPDSLGRLEQEARAVGRLNHPNILAIHDIGRHELTPYVVSELLEGETLRERLREPLPLRKALDYAVQIARGLAAAHEKGIVHRDLKPENVFVTRDGRVKILDFGLAKMVRSPFGSGGEDEITASMVDYRARTSPGTVLGTVGYMAPEQVKGRPADSRTDIFAFGTVLYEMLTGQRAFRGASAVETMGAILREEPPEPAPGGGALPPAVDRVLRRCLEKRPEERFQSARDVAFALEAVSSLSLGSEETAAIPEPGSRRRTLALVALAVLALLASHAGVFLAGRATPRAAEPSYRQVTFARGRIDSARFAPDGETVVYSASGEGNRSRLLAVRPESPESTLLGLEDALVVSVSPSSEMALLFQRPGRPDLLARAPLAGGAPREVLESVGGADWAADGSSLAVIRSTDGGARLELPIGSPLYESRGRLQGLSVSPAGDRVAFLERADASGAAAVTVVDRARKATVLGRGWPDVRRTRWSPAGDEVWFSAVEPGSGSAVHALDLRGRHRIVLRLPGRMSLHDVARDGSLLVSRDLLRSRAVGMAPGESEERDLSWLDGSWAADLSPDGRRVLLREEGEAGGAGGALYLRGTDGSPAIRLAEGNGFALSPDGRWVLSLSNDGPRLVVLPTGAGEPRRLAPGGLRRFAAAYWFPDGRRVLLCGAEEGRPSRLYVQDLEGGDPRAVTPEGTDTADAFASPVSPDGTRIFARNREGGFSIYPVAGGPPGPVAGLDAGETPIRWSSDGRLFVRSPSGLPVRVALLDPSSGARRPWRDIAPADAFGVDRLLRVLPTADGKGYVYSYRRTLSDLYLVRGVR